MKVSIYLEDTDAGGIAYHTSYLRFMERARSDFLARCGLSAVDLSEEGFLFVVRRMLIDYLMPAYLGDTLHITTKLANKRKCAVDFIQQAIRIDDNVPLCRAEVQVVCIDAVHKKPRALPTEVAILNTN